MDRPNDKKFIVGSKAFFSCYKDFKPHDSDLLILLEPSDNPRYKVYCYISLNGNCINYWKRSPLVEFIQIHLNLNKGLYLGKFLVPEFSKYIGMTIDDLKKLKPLLSTLDLRHKYEEIIFNSYIQNNDFVLTDELRLKAYESYKQSRLNLNQDN